MGLLEEYSRGSLVAVLGGNAFQKDIVSSGAGLRGRGERHGTETGNFRAGKDPV